MQTSAMARQVALNPPMPSDTTRGANRWIVRREGTAKPWGLGIVEKTSGDERWIEVSDVVQGLVCSKQGVRVRAQPHPSLSLLFIVYALIVNTPSLQPISRL
jgi:hypothetical protein